MQNKTKGSLTTLFSILILVFLGILIFLFPKISRTREFNDQLSLGDQYLQEMRYEDALIAYQEAIQIDKKKEKGYLKLSEMYASLQNYDDAADTLIIGYYSAGSTEQIIMMMQTLYPNASETYRTKIEVIFSMEEISDVPTAVPPSDPITETPPAPEEEAEPTPIPFDDTTPTLAETFSRVENDLLGEPIEFVEEKLGPSYASSDFHTFDYDLASALPGSPIPTVKYWENYATEITFTFSNDDAAAASYVKTAYERYGSDCIFEVREDALYYTWELYTPFQTEHGPAVSGVVIRYSFDHTVSVTWICQLG